MKKIIVVATTIVLLLMPLLGYGQSEQATSTAPAVAQPLVREGDFAVKLVEALKIGSVQNEAEAESMLAAVGIVPRNGWIADYPVTPAMIGELQIAVGEAADSNRLPMKRDEAVRALENLFAELGLSAVSDTSGKYAATDPPTNYSEYVDPTVINNYYYNEGPPVVTYYPPPPDYYYLYSWVPYPFWYSRFFFSGFFVLHDFHKVVIVNKRRFVVSNHVFDHKHRRFSTIDPERRYRGQGGVIFRADRGISGGRGFRSSEGRKGAESILNHDLEHRRSFGTGRRFNERISRGRNVPGAIGRGGNQRRTPTIEQRKGRTQSESAFRDGRSRTFSRPDSFSNRREIMPSEGFSRRFSGTPGKGSDRSFSAPQRGGGQQKSFSAPPRGGRGLSGDGMKGRGGGFARGHAGGCRGRC